MIRTDQVAGSGGYATELSRHWPRGGDVRAVASRFALVVALVFLIIAFSLLRPETFFTIALQSALVGQIVVVVLALVRRGKIAASVQRVIEAATGYVACYGTTALKPSTLPSNAIWGVEYVSGE